MSVYRKSFTYKGKKRLSSTFTAEFSYRGQMYRRSKFIDKKTALHWIMAEKMRLSRGEVGMTPEMRASAVLPLIEQYAESLRSGGRDEMYCYTTEKRLKRVAQEMTWLVLADVTPASVDAWKRSRPAYRNKPLSAWTIRQIIDDLRAFGHWIWNTAQRWPSNPLANVRRDNAPQNTEYRRAATLSEIEQLLAVAPDDRRAFYLFELYTPLRRATVRRLCWRNVKLDAERPYLDLPAELNKSGKPERSPLRLDVAAVLRAEKSRIKAKADDEVFARIPSVDDLRTDLEAAGVPFADARGKNRLDLHAFRKTLIGLLEEAGVGIGTAGRLLHHKSEATTRKHYHASKVDESLSRAIESAPAVTLVKKMRIAG